MRRSSVPTGAVASPVVTTRWVAVDVARGVAIVAVVLFHLVWDLGSLGFIDWQINAHRSGKIAGRVIAGSFLALVGVSLVLAHGRGIRWRRFWRREAQLVVLALAVTVFSWFYDRDELVTFGILQAIAVASVVSVGFVTLRPVFAYAAALVALALPWVVHLPGRSPWVSWTGLAEGSRPSLDWQPLFPWIALTLLAVGLTRQVVAASYEPEGWAHRLREWQPADPVTRALAVTGRHTLSIYLVHQPVLYGVLSLL
nr:heparan-alpha-glucosaminide N-acetyltransferase [Flexivirga meconopsidis]